MGTFQTLLCLVLLIFVLSVGVQAIQEVIKAALNTKASVMAQTIEKFMGDRLTLPQVQDALHLRGLDITALENFNKQDFRRLLDGIQFKNGQLKGIVVFAEATVEQAKDNIAASYEAARAAFQRAYTRRNKVFVVVLSLLAVIALNANVVILYELLSSDQAAQQAIVGKAVAVTLDQAGKRGDSQDQPTDLGAAYAHSRDQINKALQGYPILIRTSKFREDFENHPYSEIPGLLVMGILVALGAPFWNDVLKGMMGVNNALNTNQKPAS
jgi:hypothetical protein